MSSIKQCSRAAPPVRFGSNCNRFLTGLAKSRLGRPTHLRVRVLGTTLRRQCKGPIPAPHLELLLAGRLAAQPERSSAASLVAFSDWWVGCSVDTRASPLLPNLRKRRRTPPRGTRHASPAR